MRKAVAVVGVLLWSAAACTEQDAVSERAAAPQAAAPQVTATAAPVAAATEPPPLNLPPTIRVVGASSPTPSGGDALRVRPVADEKAIAAARKAGKAVGPVISYAGIARADGHKIEPEGKATGGLQIFQHPVGSGFMIVVEGKPGIGNIEVGRSTYRYNAEDPKERPDLEIQVNRPLGDGSTEVCDARRPKIGGISAVNPSSFDETPQVSAALNDFSCRFETFIESPGACTVNQFGDFEFLGKDTDVQFCMVVARSWQFPDGDTIVSVRLRDTDGNPGPVERFVLRRKIKPPDTPKPEAKPTATVSRRRP